LVFSHGARHQGWRSHRVEQQTFTVTVLPAVNDPSPENSMKVIHERVMTLIVTMDGLAPAKRGESPVSVKVPSGVFMGAGAHLAGDLQRPQAH
jgi:hypothetical protein